MLDDLNSNRSRPRHGDCRLRDHRLGRPAHREAVPGRTRQGASSIVALLGPIGAAAWALGLRLNDETGWSFGNSVYLDDLSYFFIFICRRRGGYRPRLAGIREALRQLRGGVLRAHPLATSAMMLLANSRDLVLIFVRPRDDQHHAVHPGRAAEGPKSTEAGMKYLLLRDGLCRYPLRHGISLRPHRHDAPRGAGR